MAEASFMWQCQMHYCGYVYDPDQGDPKRNVPAGTKFDDLPEGWTCPFCGASAKMFKPLAGPGSVLYENIRSNPQYADMSDEQIMEHVAKGNVEIKSDDAKRAQFEGHPPADKPGAFGPGEGPDRRS